MKKRENPQLLTSKLFAGYGPEPGRRNGGSRGELTSRPAPGAVDTKRQGAASDELEASTDQGGPALLGRNVLLKA
jgi:hypothetical protein